MTDEELEFRLTHASAGGYHAALQEVIKLLRKESGQCFADGKDEHAHIARRLANKVDELRNNASRELQGYITEAARRRNEPPIDAVHEQ